MLINSALISSFLLASVVLADLRFENRRSSFPNRTEQSPDTITEDASFTNWAGAIWDKGDNTFSYVVGTFTVPTHVKGTANSGASAWVGIDGNTCQNAILQAGVDFFPDGHGNTVYKAWYEWYPDFSHYFDLTVSPGDEIRVYVKAYSPTKGIAKIHNLSTKQYATQYLESTHALCGKNAEWIVEDFVLDGSQVPFADFGSVTFRDTKATGAGGTYTADGAIAADMVNDNHQRMASAKIEGSSVTINYV